MNHNRPATVDGILELIKVAHLNNEQLQDLKNRIGELIVYKFEYQGTVYSLTKPPPVIDESELKIDDKEAFQRLVVPYIETYSFSHIDNLHDMINALQLIHKAGLRIIPTALKFSIETLLTKIGNLENRLLTRKGRKELKAKFKQKVELLEVNFKDFIRALKERKGDFFVSVSPIVAVALLKLLYQFL